MTLVAGLSIGGLPAFIGDLMTSWRLRVPVNLPTNATFGEQSAGDGYFAAGLAQKLIVVRPYLLIAWAGSEAEAVRLILELDKVLPEGIATLENPTSALRVLNTCAEGTEMVALVISRDAIHPFGIRTRGFELDGRRIYALGSGTPAFLRHLQDGDLEMPPDSGSDSILSRGELLRFAARAFGSQWVAGIGYDEAWGGGFEVAYPDRGCGFRKVDRVLYRAWIIDLDGTYRTSGRSYFVRYYGRTLYLSCFGEEEVGYVVDAPVGPVISPPSRETVHPEWIVDSFLVARTGSFAETARHQPTHRPPQDSFDLESGVVAGWKMDKGYVDGCVRAIVNLTELGRPVAHFHRY